MSNDKVKSTAAVASAFLLVLAVGTVGWAMLRPNPSSDTRASWQNAAEGGSITPSPTVTTPPPTTPPPPTPTPTKTKKPPAPNKPKPLVTEKPPSEEIRLEPPPRIPDDPSCETHLPGTDAPASEVRTALAAAAGKQYWTKAGLNPPAPVQPVPNITVPTNLMYAFAWAESSWRSTIISCDKGIGLMQIMAGTATQMNNRFDTNHDVNTVAGNAALGATYIEWLTMYFGVFYFGTFDLDAKKAVGDNGATMRLRDVVISAYNWGPYGLENDNGTEDSTDDTIHPIPNQWYVDRVNNYMNDCPCPVA